MAEAMMEDVWKFYDEKTMTAALMTVVQMWERGELGVAPPSPFEREQCLGYLKGLPYEIDEKYVRKMGVNLTLGDLICNNIGNHFSMVASHRHHLKIVYELCKIAKVGFLEGVEMEERIRIHDLSKYGPLEAAGYSIMFGMNGCFRELQGEDKVRWDKALQSHYKTNPHHPQYAGEALMQHGDLVESLLDMLACRLERTLKGHSVLHVGDLMDIPSEYLRRYHLEDRVRIRNIIASWRESINNLALEKSYEEMFSVDFGIFVDQNQVLDLKKWEDANNYVLLPIK